MDVYLFTTYIYMCVCANVRVYRDGHMSTCMVHSLLKIAFIHMIV